MSLNTPAARRDQAFHLHPSTNLRAVQKEGPLVITRGEVFVGSVLVGRVPPLFDAR